MNIVREELCGDRPVVNAALDAGSNSFEVS